ncbi:hypothetical protein [Brevibacillus laterosporus]|uniref:hypothetical protein n=1 Tax=Brevibacillus laterosporus TaxID=1465 RepID=UPI0018F8AA10|nr:hypothetical protein [Brevibacillus laterosporus]MBG9776123.1 hypothetical protein [Brevibacillus laterosporus]
MISFWRKKRIRELEYENEKLRKRNEELDDKLREVTKWRERPNWRWKSITVSPYIFEKYIYGAGQKTFGGYLWKGYRVEVDEAMPDGYVRYEEAIEEPHKNCKNCDINFKLVLGFPSETRDFCSNECYVEKMMK